MIIGIDIDDTIANTTEEIIKYIVNDLGIKGNVDSEVIKYMREQAYLDKKLSENNIEEIVKNNFNNFVNDITVKDNVSEVLGRLKESGHKIVFITARGDVYTKNCYETTNKWLTKNNIVFDKLICNTTNKLENCIEENVDIMIDDAIITCNKFLDNNKECLLFNSIANKEVDFKGKRVDNWLDIEKIINSSNTL